MHLGCGCDSTGSSSTTCTPQGQCTCNSGYTGRTCSEQCVFILFCVDGLDGWVQTFLKEYACEPTSEKL